MKRRSFLRNLSYLAPGLLLSQGFIKTALAGSLTGGKIIIIGAGAAGLYAAKVLLEAGYEVTILEASTIHGGRVRKLEGYASFTMEAGAEWVHGKANSSGDPASFLWSSINELDPELMSEYSGFKELYALDDSSVVYPPYWDADLEFVLNFYNTLYLYDGEDILMNDYLASLGIVEGDRTWHFFESWIGSEFGTSIKRIGMKSIAVSENLWLTGSKDYIIQSPYLDVLDSLFFNATFEYIQYNKVVESIDYSGTQVNIICEDGTSYLSDQVLVTVPLSILKSGMINFTPSLSAAKQTAIDTIGMDAGMKINIRFTEKFWDPEICEMTLKNEGTLAWDPTYFKIDATDNILTFFVMGLRAETLSALGEDAIGVILNEMDELFEGAATDFYLDHFIIDWYKEPYIKGAYSYPSPNTYESLTSSQRLTLAEPVDCKVFFAGEATSNYHPATVHGALESGARAALEIIDCPIMVSATSNHQQNNLHLYTHQQIAYMQIQLAIAGNVELYLLSISGQQVANLFHGSLPAGKTELTSPINGLSEGVYLLAGHLNGTAISMKVAVH